MLQQLYIMYDDNQPLEVDKLAGASVRLSAVITTPNGGTRRLPDMLVPRKEQRRNRQDRPWWKWNDWQGRHRQQSPSSSQWIKTDPDQESTQQFVYWMEELAHDAEFHQFRTTGIHPFRVLNFHFILGFDNNSKLVSISSSNR